MIELDVIYNNNNDRDYVAEEIKEVTDKHPKCSSSKKDIILHVDLN